MRDSSSAAVGFLDVEMALGPILSLWIDSRFKKPERIHARPGEQAQLIDAFRSGQRPLHWLLDIKYRLFISKRQIGQIVGWSGDRPAIAYVVRPTDRKEGSALKITKSI